MGRRKQVHPQRRVVVDSESHPVEIEAVRSAEAQAPAVVTEAPPTVTETAASVSAELPGLTNLVAVPSPRVIVPEDSAELSAEDSAKVTAIIGRIATAVTGVTPVTEGASVAETAASVSAEGSVGQTERGEDRQGTEGTGPTGPASAEAATAEPSLLQRLYNWLMT